MLLILHVGGGGFLKEHFVRNIDHAGEKKKKTAWENRVGDRKVKQQNMLSARKFGKHKILDNWKPKQVRGRMLHMTLQSPHTSPKKQYRKSQITTRHVELPRLGCIVDFSRESSNDMFWCIARGQSAARQERRHRINEIHGYGGWAA